MKAMAADRARGGRGAAVDDPTGEDLGPLPEHAVAGGAQLLVGAGDLEAHRGDRAGVGVAGLDEDLGRAVERGPRPRHDVVLGVDDGHDQVAVERAGPLDGGRRQLLLAAGKKW